MTGTLKRVLRRLTRSAREDPAPILESHLEDETVAQKVLMQQYRLLASFGTDRLPALADVGFRKYFQFEEDGILLYIFSLVPPVNRTCVEICAGDGRECNTANLIINHGWWGHLFDGDERNVRAGRAFFARHKDTFLHPPRFTQAWISAEHVNDLVAQSGARGPVDLLSLDIDGMDYWIWKAITVIEPQVVVCETHNPIPPDLALTVALTIRNLLVSLRTTGAHRWRQCANLAERRVSVGRSASVRLQRLFPEERSGRAVLSRGRRGVLRPGPL